MITDQQVSTALNIILQELSARPSTQFLATILYNELLKHPEEVRSILERARLEVFGGKP